MSSVTPSFSSLHLSASLSQLSATQGSNRLDAKTPSFGARTEADSRHGFGAEPEPFARTLQNQINNRPPAAPRQPAMNEHNAAQTREPARSENRPQTRESSANRSAREPVREQARQAGPESAGSERSSDAASAGTQAQPDATSANASGTPADSRSDSSANSANTADSSGNTAAAAAAVAAALNSMPTQANDDPANVLAANPDAAALAGLPAAIAALNTAATETEAPQADPLLDGNAQKPLQNGEQLPKTDAGVLAAAADGKAAPQPVQARPLATAFTDKLAATAGIGGAGAASGEDGGKAIASASNTANPAHGVNVFNVLRHLPATQSAAPQLAVHTPAGAQAWAEDVGNQVRWMLGRAESKAELVLTPPNLGKLEVSISLSGDQTTAQFVASSQAARDALEQAMPRLREILQQAGIQLGQANVSTSGDQPASGDGQGGNTRGGAGSGGEHTVEAVQEGSRWLRQHNGMVDTFA